MTTVWLDTRARDLIEREAIRRRLVETGGALFGWEDDDSVVVACASGPGPHAKHRPRSFEPDPETTAEAMRAVRAASEKRYRFLGSWHTHPRGGSSPSGIDSGTARELGAQDDLLLPRPLLLILSTAWLRRKVRPRELRGWRWNPTEDRLDVVTVQKLTLDAWYCPDAPLFQPRGS